MSLFQKDNRLWYYTFYVGNRRYRKSTHTTSESKARKIEAVAFAKAQELGPLALTAKAPRLADFGAKRFLPWVNESRGLKQKSRRYYTRGWELLKRTPVVNMPIDRITSEITDRLAISGVKRFDATNLRITLGQLLGQLRKEMLKRASKYFGIWSRRSDLNR